MKSPLIFRVVAVRADGRRVTLKIGLTTRNGRQYRDLLSPRYSKQHIEVEIVWPPTDEPDDCPVIILHQPKP